MKNLETIGLAVGGAFVFVYAFTMVPLFRSGMACRSADRVELAADTASFAIMESAFEPQTVCTPAAPESDAIASTNASKTRPAAVQKSNPTLVELHHKALEPRRQAEIVTARAPVWSVAQAGRAIGIPSPWSCQPNSTLKRNSRIKKALDLPGVTTLINATGATSAQ